jgi:hypothetical protein
MKKVTIPITNTARRFGYIIWPSCLDDQMHAYFGQATQVNLLFMANDLGTKNIDWKHKRISIGYRWTRSLPEEKSLYRLTFSQEDNKLIVK